MMCVNDKSVFVMALVLVALMSIFVPVASADGSQTWYLHNDLLLDKTGSGTGTYSLPDDSSRKWSAGPAECHLTMGEGTWTQSLDYTATCDGVIHIAVYNDDSSTELAHAWDVAITEGSRTETVDMTGSSVEFETGHHLVLHLKWFANVGTPPLTIKCASGNSKLRSPSTDPGYPVPELSSLVLFSVGLLAVAGCVVYRRRK